MSQVVLLFRWLLSEQALGWRFGMIGPGAIATGFALLCLLLMKAVWVVVLWHGIVGRDNMIQSLCYGLSFDSATDRLSMYAKESWHSNSTGLQIGAQP